MAKRKTRNTKGKIISAAWELFYEQGYDDTTVEEIIEKSQTSKGSFYHYFEGKDALLGSLSILFDEKYQELMETIDDNMNCFEKLMYLNRELFKMVENGVAIDLMARLYSSQLITKGEKHLLDHNRVYFKVLKQIVVQGQQRGQIRSEIPVNEIVKVYAMCEKAILYEWCICGGDFSLIQYTERVFPMLLGGYKI